MTHPDPRLAEQFLHQSLYQPKQLAHHDGHGDETPPLPIKAYRGQPRIPLPEDQPSQLGDVRLGFAEFRTLAGPPPAAGDLDAGQLSVLLYRTFGMSRVDFGPAEHWPYHRTVPSARCLFPTQLYVCVPDCPGVPAGAYYYDPAHHTLVLLRPGDHRDLLGAATGTDLAEATGVLVLSSAFGKTAQRYRDYAYRLCTQEAGLVAGNALHVSGVLGRRAAVHYQFLDEPVNRLLGLHHPDEATLAVLPLHPGTDPRPPHRSQHTAADLTSELPEIAPTQRAETTLDQGHCWLLAELDRSSQLKNTGQLAAPLPPAPVEPGSIPAPPEDPEPWTDLVDAVLARHSGHRVFNTVARPLPQIDLWRLLRHALEPYPNDLVTEGAPPIIDCRIIVVSVEGLPPGVYRLTGGALRPYRLGPIAPLVQEPPQPGAYAINYRSANLGIYLTADHRRALARFGNRAYRILMQEAGIIAQRICLLAGAAGLTGRIHNGYRQQRFNDLLGVAGVTVFQIMIGRSRPCGTYATPVRF